MKNVMSEIEDELIDMQRDYFLCSHGCKLSEAKDLNLAKGMVVADVLSIFSKARKGPFGETYDGVFRKREGFILKVQSAEGENLFGCYDSEEDANRRLRRILSCDIFYNGPRYRAGEVVKMQLEMLPDLRIIVDNHVFWGLYNIDQDGDLCDMDNKFSPEEQLKDSL